MALFAKRQPSLPDAARSAAGLAKGEKVLAWATEEPTGVVVIATRYGLYAVSPAGERLLGKPWHEVDAGSWNPETGQLTVTWVDRSRPSQWALGETSLLPETLRERVQASVVLAQQVDLGPRRRGRAVIRQDLATGDLLEQQLRGRGARPDDAELTRALGDAAAYLREQVGR
ncbi:hypothetical protein [Knoellia koreensis]|uniref:Uncharacterized protein n=1 Tax=Knoellia koreensis TaxID=2730921 RepID=A0A849HAY1_9MICO|nr:hypothetical protein [Knoellia sp. DB2414S]NNM44568.1 hypothetical protein [Knoellia sp. DB2414S]